MGGQRIHPERIHRERIKRIKQMIAVMGQGLNPCPSEVSWKRKPFPPPLAGGGVFVFSMCSNPRFYEL